MSRCSLSKLNPVIVTRLCVFRHTYVLLEYQVFNSTIDHYRVYPELSIDVTGHKKSLSLEAHDQCFGINS